MKRHLIYAAMALMVLGCAKNEIQDVAGDASVKQTLNVSIDDFSAKTCLGDYAGGAYKVNWEAGDAISVNGVSSQPLAEGGSKAVFSFTQTIEAPFNAVYPAEVVSDGGIVLNPGQTYSKEQFDSNAAVMLGYGSGSDLSMSIVTALVKVTLTQSEAQIKNIKIYALGGEPLCGNFSYDCQAGTISYKDGGFNYVNVTSGIEYEDGKASAVIAIPAGEYAKGFAINVVAADGSQMTRTAYTSAGVTVQAGSMLAMPELAFVANAAYSGGSGTAADPYLIATAEDLVALSAAVASATTTASFKQVADIDMSGVANFTPIGNYAAKKYFNGVYDGNGYSISCLTVRDCASAGLFGCTNDSGAAVLKNITLRNAFISANGDLAGAILGDCYGGTVENCKVVSSSVVCEGSNVGGIAGRVYVATIKNCTIDELSSVQGVGNVGGIGGGFGTSKKALTFSGCTSACSVTGETNVGGIMGGVTGANWQTGTIGITSCTSSGTVKASGTSAGGILGGVPKMTTAKINITLCESFADVTTDSKYAGGILGAFTDMLTTASVKIEGCLVSGDVKANATSGNSYAGGIIGLNGTMDATSSVSISSCLVSGDIAAGTTYAAGVIGGMDKSGGSVSIDKCWVSGNIKGSYAIGGIIGCLYTNTNDAVVKIVNSAYFGNRMETTSRASNGYYAQGGIVGWNRLSGTTAIVNCVSRVKEMAFAGEPSEEASYPYGIGGILGYTSVGTGSTSHTKVCGCYTTIARNGFIKDGAETPEKDSKERDINYGGIYGLFSSELSAGSSSFISVYHNGGVKYGPTTFALESADITPYASEGALLTSLNEFAQNPDYSAYGPVGWVAGADGFPIQNIFTK